MDAVPPPDPGSSTGRHREVAVRTPDGRKYPGRVELVCNERVVIAFPAAVAPLVDEETLVALRFHPVRGGRIILRGKLIDARPGKRGERLFDFRFDAPPPRVAGGDPATDSGAGLEDHGNRRGAYRVATDRNRLMMTVAPDLDGSRPVLRKLTDLRLQAKRRHVDGRMLDLSVDGVGVMVERADARAFDPGDRVAVSFWIGGADDPLMASAVVRQLTPRYGGIRYGLEFELGASREHRVVQNAVLEYVMKLQRKRLRYRAG